ncbi:Hypothetical predicted protein, partial [Paramuricea clavata]
SNSRLSLAAFARLTFESRSYGGDWVSKEDPKSRFGKDSEIAKVLMREILDPPVIQGTNPKKKQNFSDKLMYSVQAQETMKNLDQVNGAVAMTLDKLPCIFTFSPSNSRR